MKWGIYFNTFIFKCELTIQQTYGNPWYIKGIAGDYSKIVAISKIIQLY
jgi:hypothetical protein